MDPRVVVTEKALEDQLALAIDVWNKMADESAMRYSMDSLKSQLANLESSGKSHQGVLLSVGKLARGLQLLSDSLRDGELAGLEGDIMSADREPTSQMRQAYETLRSNYSSVEKRWSKLKTRDLPDVNRELESAGLPQLRLIESMGGHLVVPGHAVK